MLGTPLVPSQGGQGSRWGGLGAVSNELSGCVVQTLVSPLFQGHLSPAPVFPKGFVHLYPCRRHNLLPPKLTGSLGQQRWGEKQVWEGGLGRWGECWRLV